jgi:hypothetical protein
VLYNFYTFAPDFSIITPKRHRSNFLFIHKKPGLVKPSISGVVCLFVCLYRGQPHDLTQGPGLTKERLLSRVSSRIYKEGNSVALILHNVKPAMEVQTDHCLSMRCSTGLIS